MLNNRFGIYIASGYQSVSSVAIWTAAQSSAPSGDYLAVQGDRNLVVYSSTSAVLWSPMVYNNGTGRPFCLSILDSGNLIWYDSTGTIIWQSNSAQTG